MPAWSGSGEVPFSPADYCFAVFSHGEMGEGALWGLLYKGTNLIIRALPS